MLSWLRYPLIRFLVFLIAGILLRRILALNSPVFIYLFLTGLITYPAILLVLKKDRFVRYNLLVGVMALGTLALAGISLTIVKDDKNLEFHLLSLADPPEAVTGKLVDFPVPDSTGTRFVVDCRSGLRDTAWRKIRGKIQVTCRHNSGSSIYNLRPGALIMIRGKPRVIGAPRNPGQFDYASFMAGRNIYHQMMVPDHKIVLIRNGNPFNILTLAGTINRNCQKILNSHLHDSIASSLCAALVLGARNRLDDFLVADFAHAGISHILAVSGLHVGILYLMLFFILKPLFRNKKTAWVGSVFIILILVLFAFITGLSPSVLRAVILFSIIESGRRLGRKSISFNSLAASAFLLLAIDPGFLTTLGFQLSYLAVTGILFFQPKIYRLLVFENDLLDYAWQLVSVSLAAQITTFPLTLHYFHAFPVYFLAANIIAIPAAFVILTGGLAILALYFTGPVADVLGKLLSIFIHGFNFLIHGLASLPFSQIGSINLSNLMVVILYAGLLIFMFLIASRKIIFLYLTLFFAFTLFFLNAFETFRAIHQHKIIFYYVHGGTQIELVKGREGIIIADSVLSTKPERIRRIMGNHCLAEHHPCSFSVAEQHRIPEGSSGNINFYVWEKKKIVMIRDKHVNHGFRPENILLADYIILAGNSGYSIDAILKNFQSRCWIIDGSAVPAASRTAIRELTSRHCRVISLEESGSVSFPADL